MKLRQLVMRRPNNKFIQAPSNIRPTVEINADTFTQYADKAQSSLVSLNKDGISDPQQITSYFLPGAVEGENGKIDIWPGRYIVDSD